MDIRRRVYELLEVAASGDRLSRIVDLSILTLIVLNVLVVVIESTEPAGQPLPSFYVWFENVSVAVFTIEYVLRWWSITESERYRGLVGRLAWAATPMALIDVLAIAPTYLVWFGVVGAPDLRVMRALRLIRLFRLAKLSRYNRALRTFGIVLHEKRGELGSTLFLLGLMLLIASTLMYFIESARQPEHFSSIPAAMWWGVATLTTVGYGDIYPITPVGKLLGAMIAVLGIGMFALPAGILGAAFNEALEKQRERQAEAEELMRERAESDGGAQTHGLRFCPHCGEELPRGS